MAPEIVRTCQVASYHGAAFSRVLTSNHFSISNRRPLKKYRCRRDTGKLSNNYCYTYLAKDQHARSNLLVYSTIQCSTIVIMLYDVIVEQCHNALSSVVHKNVRIL